MPDAESLYPLEVVVPGVPISLQSKSAKSREAWKRQVTEPARRRRHETYALGYLDDRALAVTIYRFPNDRMVRDICNIVKPIMDAMIHAADLNESTRSAPTLPGSPGEGANPLRMYGRSGAFAAHPRCRFARLLV